MAAFHLRTFGGLTLHREGFDGPTVVGPSKGLAILAYLATTPERQAGRSHLSALLWPDRAENRRSNLRQALYYLRKKTGTRLTRQSGETLGLAPEAVDVDLLRFERALEEERHRDVVELWDGPFLQGVSLGGSREFREWVEVEQTRTRTGLLAAHHELVGSLLRRGDAEEAIRYARRYAGLEPLDEEVQRVLIRTLLEAGKRAEAFAAYQRYGARLREALDEEPAASFSEEMRELQAELFGRLPRVPGPGGEGGGEPDPDEGRSTGSSGPARRAGTAVPARPRRAAWAKRGLAGLVALAGAVLLGFRLAGYLADPASGAAAATLLLKVRGEGLVAALQATGDGADTLYTTPDTRYLLARQGRSAGVAIGSSGRDLVLTGGDGREERRVAESPADEVPLAWSPDGRRLLYWRGRWTGESGTYRAGLWSYHRTTGESHPVTGFPAGSNPPAAAYSPDGTRLALVTRGPGTPRLLVGEADGSSVETRDRGLLKQERPAWSPDGRRLAYGVVGEDDYVLVRTEPGAEGEPQPLLRRPVPLRAVAWLPDGRLLYLEGRPSDARLRALDPARGTSRTLADGLSVQRVRDIRLPPDSAWVEAVELRPRHGAVSPGQRLEVTVTVRDARGEAVDLARVPLRVRTTDTTVLRVRREAELSPGEVGLQVVSPGRAALVATAGGWRSDTLALVSRPLEVRRPEVLFREDWSGGIDPERWYGWGEPRPYVTAPAAPADAPADGDPGIPRAFVSNGDANHMSGAVSREAFSADRGLTLEWWARMPFTGEHFQDLIAGFVGGLPTDHRRSWAPGTTDEPEGIAWLHCTSHGDDCSVCAGDGYVEEREVPADPGRWHRHALQLAPDGRVSWIVDGRLRWRSPPGEELAPEAPGRVHVAIGGNALSREIYHGPVTVYRGARYELAGDADPAR